MRKYVFALMAFLMLSSALVLAVPVMAQDDGTFTVSEKAFLNALIETCYGTRVLLDLNDPAKTEVSLAEAGLDAETTAALIADSEQTDGSYEALADLLLSYCFGPDTVTTIRATGYDRPVLGPVLVDYGIEDIDAFFILVDEYVIFENQIYAYFESYSFTEEQYSAIFYTMEYGDSYELTDLLVEYGVDEAEAESFVEYAEETIDEIESEGSADEDGDGELDIEDTDDDGDGVEDVEDTDDDGDGVEDMEEDDDADDDGIDDEYDTDDDGDEIDDVEDTDDDGDGTDDSEEESEDDGGMIDDGGDEGE